MLLISKRMPDKVSKNNVAITMTMEIWDGDEKDITRVETNGQLLHKGNRTVLTFSEKNENNEQTDSLITIYPGRVSIKRSGAVSMLQKFREHQLTENVYRHQFGTIHMETNTEHISYQKQSEDNPGKLFIRYTTSLNGDTPRKHRLIILIKDRGGK